MQQQQQQHQQQHNQHHQQRMTINQNKFNQSSLNPGRVICNICNKELCNKYFLRQHVSHRHKLTFDEYLEKYEDPATSRSILLKSQMNNMNNTTTNSNTSQIVQANNHKKPLNVEHEDLSEQNKRKRKYSGNSSASFRSTSNSYEYVSSNSDCEDYAAGNTASKKTKIDTKPLDDEDDDEVESNMQPFMIEYDQEDEDDDMFGRFFMPCMIYLPVKSKLNDSISVRVKLKPISYANDNNECSINDNLKSRNELLDQGHKNDKFNEKNSASKRLNETHKNNVNRSIGDKLITTA